MYTVRVVGLVLWTFAAMGCGEEFKATPGGGGTGGTASGGGGATASGGAGATASGGGGGGAQNSGGGGAAASGGGGAAASGGGGAAASGGGGAQNSGGAGAQNSGGAGTAGSHTGGAGPVDCSWSGAGDCAPGSYCNAPACGPGVCTPLPTEESNLDLPVCGCDGVTYWNGSVAAVHGVAVRAAGPCAIEFQLKCGGPYQVQCPEPGFQYCNYRRLAVTGCGLSDPEGDCWGMPALCPDAGVATHRRCAAQNEACLLACQAIKAQETFFYDLSCAT